MITMAAMSPFPTSDINTTAVPLRTILVNGPRSKKDAKRINIGALNTPSKVSEHHDGHKFVYKPNT